MSTDILLWLALIAAFAIWAYWPRFVDRLREHFMQLEESNDDLGTTRPDDVGVHPQHH